MQQRSFSITTGLLLLLMICVVQTGNGQQTIQEQFDQFYENETSNWQEYKLIKQPRLKGFWKVVSDTLKVKNQLISSANSKARSLQTNIDSLKSQLSAVETQLAESEAVNDEISFIGIPMAKSIYNVMVWLIIFALIFGVVSVYLMYVRSNSVTKKIQKAYSSLENEYTDHKNKSRESQVKLKRELQTALNTLHDNRINF